MTSRSSKILIGIIVMLFLVICAMTWLLITTPGRPVSTAPTTMSTSTVTQSAATTSDSSSTLPLSTNVYVTAPASGATVGKTFTVSGTAPSGWFFEAVFPIQVRDPNDNLIGTGQGQAKGDWTAAGPITFTASVSITTDYKGDADLILLRDNPSGLPENSDEVTLPIVIK